MVINDIFRTYAGPGSAKHNVISASDVDTVVLDIFHPIREDFLKGFEV